MVAHYIGLINTILGTLFFPVALLLICICKCLAYFRLGKITVNAAKTSTLFYLYAHKYCSSGDNQMRFSVFIAVTCWVSRYNHTMKLTSPYNYIIQIHLEQTGVDHKNRSLFRKIIIQPL